MVVQQALYAIAGPALALTLPAQRRVVLLRREGVKLCH